MEEGFRREFQNDEVKEDLTIYLLLALKMEEGGQGMWAASRRLGGNFFCEYLNVSLVRLILDFLSPEM